MSLTWSVIVMWDFCPLKKEKVRKICLSIQMQDLFLCFRLQITTQPLTDTAACPRGGITTRYQRQS